MVAHNEDDDNVLNIVRGTNKALRSVNRQLRRKLTRLEQQSDDNFLTLCETESNENAAEQALRKLWEEGDLESLCSPEDYEFIVKVSLRSLRAHRGTAEAPAQSHVQDFL